ncbi:MAG: leucyl/phenylalanyl-tRNA--protein transferase [Gammaproteobacteria bacterium]
MPEFICQLARDDINFPDPCQALHEPNGLLAIGGDLRPERLLAGYRKGIFPWYQDDHPILWWSPDPRTVLFPQNIKISRSLHKTLRNKHFKVTFDKAFCQVIMACAAPRETDGETWITQDMQQAYIKLHEQGYAHSVETWLDDELVGGLYGVAVGKIFFGESMFSRLRDASKVALVHLAWQLHAWDFALIDCQLPTEHLFSLGAENIKRLLFLEYLQQEVNQPHHLGQWILEVSK